MLTHVLTLSALRPSAWIYQLVLGAALTLPLRAQFTVRVVDVDSIPIPYALVRLGNAEPRATDVNGAVRFSSPLGGAVNFAVQRLGYQPFKASVAPGSDANYVIVMQPIRSTLDTLRTIAARETPLSRTGFYDRMERVRMGAITGEFITPEELETRNADQISHMLRGRRSVTVGAIADGMRKRPVIQGRGGSCAMTVLLDGVRVNGMLHTVSGGAPTSIINQRHIGNTNAVSGHTSIDELVAAREIMAIEVYGSTANAPAELIPLTGGGSCGIVALWTGPRR